MGREPGLAAGIPARLTKAEGRRFALVVGGAFIGIAALFFWKGHATPCLIAAGIGTAVLFAGLVLPDRLGPVERAWMGLAHAISKVTTPLIMGLLFFVVMTPAGLIGRLFGHRPLTRAASGGVWVSRPSGQRRGDLDRQF
jgi:hypothetical protein